MPLKQGKKNSLSFWTNGHIGVLMGGCSCEREISIKSGKAVFAALKAYGCRVSALDLQSERPQIIKNNLRKEKIDLAFIALHGRFGEDGQIQQILKEMNIPFTGSGPSASARTMNKILSQDIFQKKNIPICHFMTVHRKNKIEFEEMRDYFGSLPVVVKPASQGSSIGVNFVRKKSDYKRALKTAFRYGDAIIVEKYVAGRELTVGILAEKALPVIEIVSKREFFDYRAKYEKGKTEYIVPADLSKPVSQKCKRIALNAHQALGCFGFSRVDLMLDDDQNVYVLEVNAIPGFTETSLLPKAAKATGISFTDLCLKIIEISYAQKK